MPRQRKSEQQRRGERAAGQHICRLLGSSANYRVRWEAAATQVRHGEVNQSAVCHVLAHYLWDAGLEPDTRTDLPRILKDPVSRALRGANLSRHLLDTILTAFEFSTEDAEYTKRLYRGDEPPNVIIGNLPRSDIASPENRPYRTLSLHHFHYIGPDGRPSRHRILREIRVLHDGVTSNSFGSDTAELVASRIGGGTPGEPYQRSENEWWVDINLPQVLNRGDEHLLEFKYRFHYQIPPEPEFRLIVHQRVENFSMCVQFDSEKVPQKIWWVEWLDYREPNDTIVHREPVALDSEHVAYRRLDLAHRAVVGFLWEF